MFAAYSFVTPQSQIESTRLTLPNGWSLTPAGEQLPLGDLPLNIVVSPSKRFLAVTNNGQSRQSLQLIDARSKHIVSNVQIAKSWLGLCFSADDRYLYASGGNDNWILRYHIVKNSLELRDTFVLGPKWPKKISPAGLSLDDRRGLLYVVTKENNSLYVVDTRTKAVKKRLPLGGEGYTCILSPDHGALYISCWGSDTVRIFDTRKQVFAGAIAVGNHPNDMCITRRDRKSVV
jgi:YVTN family beta-propeller protein